MNEEQIRLELKDYNSLIIQQKQIAEAVKIKKQAIQEGCFGMQAPDQEGTEKIQIAGCEVKRVCRLTRSLTKDADELEQAIQSLTDATAKERLVTWKPSLSVAEYKRLNAEDKAIIDGVLTVKLGSPSLTIEGDFS